VLVDSPLALAAMQRWRMAQLAAIQRRRGGEVMRQWLTRLEQDAGELGEQGVMMTTTRMVRLSEETMTRAAELVSAFARHPLTRGARWTDVAVVRMAAERGLEVLADELAEFLPGGDEGAGHD
jgi:hypothetical protein